MGTIASKERCPLERGFHHIEASTSRFSIATMRTSTSLTGRTRSFETRVSSFLLVLYRIKISADGGIRLETVPKLRQAGADIITPGSLLFKSQDPKQTASWIRGQ